MTVFVRDGAGCGIIVSDRNKILTTPSIWFIVNRNEDDEMQEQYFTLDRIAKIVGKNPATIRTHINRGYVLGKGPRDGSTDKEPGKHERFSVHTLTEFFLAYKIEAAGVNLKLAFKYAADFAHVGGTGITSAGGLIQRIPSLPFHYNHGYTYMGMMAGQSAEIASKGDPSITNLHFRLRSMTGSAESEPMIVINVTKVFQEVCEALELDWCAVLNANYQEG